MAALVAPGFPMASVPTGTPAGICTIDSRASTPLNRRGNRNAEHGDERLRCNHPGQVCRSARGGDDHEQPALFRRRCVLEHPVRRAVRRYHPSLERDCELLEHGTRRREMLIVALAAHDHADEWPWHRQRSRASRWKGTAETVNAAAAWARLREQTTGLGKGTLGGPRCAAAANSEGRRKRDGETLGGRHHAYALRQWD